MNQTSASVTPPDRNRLLAQLDNTPAWDVICLLYTSDAADE